MKFVKMQVLHCYLAMDYSYNKSFFYKNPLPYREKAVYLHQMSKLLDITIYY